MNGASEQAIRRASGPVLTSGLLVVLDHSVMIASLWQVSLFSICGPRTSFRARPRPRKRDEEAETTARSRGYSFINS